MEGRGFQTFKNVGSCLQSFSQNTKNELPPTIEGGVEKIAILRWGLMQYYAAVVPSAVDLFGRSQDSSPTCDFRVLVNASTTVLSIVLHL